MHKMSKRIYLSIADKLKILNKVHEGIKIKYIAEKYCNSTSSLSVILKNRKTIVK